MKNLEIGDELQYSRYQKKYLCKIAFEVAKSM